MCTFILPPFFFRSLCFLIDSSSTRRRKTRGRGPTRCLDVWNMDGKIPITTNEFGQPIGVEAPKLVNFLGTIARNGHMAPLNYIEWRALPDESKEKMWQQVQVLESYFYICINIVNFLEVLHAGLVCVVKI